MTTFVDNDSLFIQYKQTQNIRLRDVLIKQNLGLVYNIAHKMVNCTRTESFEDLVQIGSGGLIKAVERFDPNQGKRFSTLAVPFIQGAILQWLRDRGHLVKVPRKLQETHQKIKRTAKKDDISYNAAALKLGIDKDLVEECSAACTQHLAELPQTITTSEVEEQFEWEALLGKLPTQQASIIQAIYIDVMPIREVARSHSLKLTQVRQLETEAISALKAIAQGLVKCPRCEKYETIKYGKRSGQQRYQCKPCGLQFSENPKPEGRPGYDADIKRKALSYLEQGKSLRWCETYLLIENSTICRWKQTAEKLNGKIFEAKTRGSL